VVVDDVMRNDSGVGQPPVAGGAAPSEALAAAQQGVASALVAAVEAVDSLFRATRLPPGSAGRTPTVTPRPALPQSDEASLSESASKRLRDRAAADAGGLASPSGGGPVLDTCPSGACGTTVTAVLALFDWLFVAWVGDSEAGVVRDGGSFVRLTPRTHVASNAEEAERVQRAGGLVTGERVGGVLELTRTVGDRQLHVMGAAAVPEVTWTRLTGEDDTLILASDGLWDVVSRRQVVDILRLSGRIHAGANPSSTRPIAPATSTRSDVAASGSPVVSAFGSGLGLPGQAQHAEAPATAEASLTVAPTTAEASLTVAPTTEPSPAVVASSAAARASRRSLRAEVRVPAERLLAEAIRSGSADDITVMFVDLRIPSMPRSAAEAAAGGDDLGSDQGPMAPGGFVSPSELESANAVE
jgi:serine/threonine protein phosphatase PrpC